MITTESMLILNKRVYSYTAQTVNMRIKIGSYQNDIQIVSLEFKYYCLSLQPVSSEGTKFRSSWLHCVRPYHNCLPCHRNLLCSLRGTPENHFGISRRESKNVLPTCGYITCSIFRVQHNDVRNTSRNLPKRDSMALGRYWVFLCKCVLSTIHGTIVASFEDN